LNDNNYQNFVGEINLENKNKDESNISELENELIKKDTMLTGLMLELNSLGVNKDIIQTDGALSCRSLINEKVVSIVYIDDNANNGWKDIFSLILFGDKNSEKICTLSEDEFSDDRLIDSALKLIKEKYYGLQD